MISASRRERYRGVALAAYGYLVTRTVRVRWSTVPANSQGMWSCWHEHILAATIAFLAVSTEPPPVIVTLETPRGRTTTYAYGLLGGQTIRLTDHEKRGDRASSTRDIVNTLRSGRACLMTLDGARGPFRIGRGGAERAASRARTEIHVVELEVIGKLRLRRWDRLIVPLPFARISVRPGH